MRLWQKRAITSLTNSSVLTAEVSEQVKKNTIATGCCFAEVEVDIKLGKIKILHIINVHDSGKLLNPQLARCRSMVVCLWEWGMESVNS